MKMNLELRLTILTLAGLILGIGAILFALTLQSTTTSQSTQGELRIFYNEQIFILYVPSTLSSLEGFAFEITYDETHRRLVGLNEFSETAKLSHQNFPSPVCISFSLAGGSLISLPECQEVTKIHQPLNENQEAFWIDPVTRSPVNLRVLSGTRIVGQCDAQMLCTVSFSPTHSSQPTEPRSTIEIGDNIQ